MKLKLRIMILIFLILLTRQLYSQQIMVQTVLVNQNLEMFFVNSLDRFGPKTALIIFRVFINNQYPTNRNVRLTLTIESENFGELLSARTNQFSIPSGMTKLTNRELIAESGKYSLQNLSISNAAEKLKSNILSTGRLPTDVYDFTVEVEDLTMGMTDSDQFQVHITNPKKLDLLFPGYPASGRRDDCQVIFTNLPQFRWESDMRRFRVIVAEARPGEDPESALNQEPRFVQNFIVQRRGMADLDSDAPRSFANAKPIPGTSFQYPSTGVILTLRPGKTYYWRVIGVVQTSSGDVRKESEIYCFRIARLAQPGSRREQLQFLLRNILGSDYDKLFGEGGELEGYEATRFMLNGEIVTVGDLIRKMNKLSSSYNGYIIE